MVAADLGASGGKMAKGYFDGENLKISNFYTFENKAVELNQNLYWDIFGLYNSIVDGTTKYAALENVESIAVDTWGASYGLLDSERRLLEPTYHYRDIRTMNTVQNMYRVVEKQTLFEMTGCQCNRTYTLPQLYSYIERGSDMLNKAYKMLFLPDLLAYFLSGEISTEMTIAGTSALMDTEQENWCFEVFEKFNIPTHLLTAIVDAGTIKGNILPDLAKRIGTSQTKVIATVGHDSASAIAAIPGFGPNKLYISIGTNISMGVEREESIVSDLAYKGGFKNTGGLARKKIVYRDFAAFWIINELRRIWQQEGDEYTFQDLIEIALETSSKQVFIDVEEQAFNNAGGDMRIKINEYLRRTNQNELESVGEFVRCVFESITLKIKYCAEFLREKLSIPFEEVYIVNGGTRNQLLMQMISDALHMEIKAGLPYATLAGNILTQLYALRKVRTIDEVRDLSKRSFEMKVYEPIIKSRWDDWLDIAIEKGTCK